MGLFSFLRTFDINEGIKEFQNTQNAILLDVRTIEEYSEGHIDGSINIPLQNIKNISNVIKDKSTPLFVHCYSGSRSGQAVSYLSNVGYTNVKNISGISAYRGKVAMS